MEIFALLAFTGLFWSILAGAKKPPSPTPEEELGAAISKYLSKGVKVRIDKD